MASFKILCLTDNTEVIKAQVCLRFLLLFTSLQVASNFALPLFQQDLTRACFDRMDTRHFSNILEYARGLKRFYASPLQTQIHVNDSQKPCKKLAQDLQKSFRSLAKVFQESCKRFAKDLWETCKKLATWDACLLGDLLAWLLASWDACLLGCLLAFWDACLSWWMLTERHAFKEAC